MIDSFPEVAGKRKDAHVEHSENICKYRHLWQGLKMEETFCAEH
jgi:hypothetical protein